MVLPNADGVHSAGGGPPPVLHTLTVNSPDTVLCFNLGPRCYKQLYSHLYLPHLTSPLPFLKLSNSETLSLAESTSLFSMAQEVSCIFKDGDLVSIATEN